MKNSKTFLLLALVTALVIAVSACAVIPSQTSAAGYNGKTVIATVNAIDGDKLTLSIQSAPSGFGADIFQSFNGSFAYTYTTMSVQSNASAPSYSYEFNFSDISFATNFSNFSYNYYAPTVTLKTLTVAPEMLVGISVGDIVDVTFDANENVIKIEKRVSHSNHGDKDVVETKETITADKEVIETKETVKKQK